MAPSGVVPTRSTGASTLMLGMISSAGSRPAAVAVVPAVLELGSGAGELGAAAEAPDGAAAAGAGALALATEPARGEAGTVGAGASAPAELQPARSSAPRARPHSPPNGRRPRDMACACGCAWAPR